LAKPARRIKHVPAAAKAAEAPGPETPVAEQAPEKASAAEPPIEPESDDALPFVKEPY
jgi:hypothetical protein